MKHHRFLLSLHKSQLQISANLQNINVSQICVAMFVSVCLFAVDKHIVMMGFAGDSDLQHTRVILFSTHNDSISKVKHVHGCKCVYLERLSFLKGQVSKPLLCTPLLHLIGVAHNHALIETRIVVQCNPTSVAQVKNYSNGGNRRKRNRFTFLFKYVTLVIIQITV